ncbi:MAG: hypothetical protein JW924_03715 [Fusobacteriaceae bacterium]|nr:hypothetical protein [Fusobacteriaceae bacterium]
MSKNIILEPKTNKHEEIEITDSIISDYKLKEWADEFTLMTAGYRSKLDPKNINSRECPFNIVTVSILGEAKARVFARKLSKGKTGSVHIGGETRPHTQEFIGTLARIYAANGFNVHLRKGVSTTPIWYSSYGTFFEEYDTSDNLTASHSSYYKGGWKPLDFEGKQLVEEEKDIVNEVKKIVQNCETIKFAPYDSELIQNDFDVDKDYVNYIKTIISPNMLSEIGTAANDGFKCAAYSLGGSMKATTERLFELLSIKTGKNGVVQYYLGEEDSQYHKVGQIDGVDYGVDPSKKEVYANIGAQELLLEEKANVVLIWDPDGDRINIVTVASADIKEKATNYGLTVDEKFTENDKSIVYFTPNQLYFMLTAFRLNALKESNEISQYDWFSVRSVASTRSIDELLSHENIPIVDVCVGFKHLGTLSSWIENNLGEKKTYPNYVSTGKEVIFGNNPRALIMYEESGGANFGGTEMLKNKSGSKSLITMREKDGMQVGLFVLALAAHLHNKNISFAEYYIQTIDKYNIKYKYFKREDYKLYEETLTGNELEKAKEEGMKKKNNIMEYFSKLIEESKNGKPASEIHNTLCESLSTKLPSTLTGIYDAGADKSLRGVLLKFQSYWFLIRESGTEVVLRYYVEGENNDETEIVLNLLKSLDSKIG